MDTVNVLLLNVTVLLRLLPISLLLFLLLFFLQRADHRPLEENASVVQFQSSMEQLGAAVQQLQEQLSVQEQDWQQAFNKLSAELDCKVGGAWRGTSAEPLVPTNRSMSHHLQLSKTELEPLRKQLDSRWRSIAERLQGQESVEVDDAAVLRKWAEPKNPRPELFQTFLLFLLNWLLLSFVLCCRQLVDRFHCLSCDRPVVKYSNEQ